MPAPNPFALATVVFFVCLIAAPLIWFPFDVESCWLPWSRASEGVAPWRIYSTRADCNYPPFVLVLLTIQEAVRRLLHAQETGVLSIILTKWPNITAHLAGALAGYTLLRGNYGETYARRFALLYALSLPLFVNAALWGQADALLALPMVCAVIFSMRGTPIPAGIALGIALTIKLQAIVIAPVLLLYVGKRFGWKPLVQATAAGLAVMLAISLPFLLAGTGESMLKAYTGAADYYPLRTLNTFNIWSYLNHVDEYVRHLPSEMVNKDDRLALGPMTYRDVSVSLFGVALSFLLVALWRRTTAQMLAWTSALSVWAFVTLCTQMHERYWVPGAALFLLVAPESWFALGIALLTGLTAAWNQWLVLVSNFMQYHRVPAWVKWSLDMGWAPSLTYVSLLNVLLLSVGLGFVGWLAMRPIEETNFAIAESVADPDT
ncbi:MAG: DUF2029 domain-containing protein [Akkermansiaceae bacterium]|nr:DUF2029 domain-containing protein [Armatimonadota bacterium]